MTKYALYTYTTCNVGDEIQSIAARRFLPQVDYYVNRDELKDFHPDTDEEVKLIMNGWYSHKPWNIAISQENIHGLATSIFIADNAKNAFSENGGGATTLLTTAPTHWRTEHRYATLLRVTWD